MNELEEFPAVMTPDMVAKILMIGRNTTYDLLRSGEIPSVKVGKQYRITGPALRDYLTRSCQSDSSVL